MEGAELQDGAARAGAHDASGDADAGPGTTQLTPPQPARLGPQPPPRLQSAEEICNIVLALGVKAAAEEGAAQGGSAGGGSQEATGAQGEEGVIARGTHLATSNMHVDGDQVACNLQSVGSVRSNAAKGKAIKETVSITEMARRVKMWGITKPQNAKHSVWKWGFKYAHPPIGPAAFHNQALCALCLVTDLGVATVKLGKDNSPSALVTHLQHAHPKEYAVMWQMEQQRKTPAQVSRTSPRKRAAGSQVPGAHGHVNSVRSSLDALFGGAASGQAPAQVHAPVSAARMGLLAKRASLHPSTVTLLVFLHEVIPGGIQREALSIIEHSILVE